MSPEVSGADTRRRPECDLELETSTDSFSFSIEEGLLLSSVQHPRRYEYALRSSLEISGADTRCRPESDLELEISAECLFEMVDLDFGVSTFDLNC